MDCYELVDALCGALHEEFMEVFQRAIPDLPEVSIFFVIHSLSLMVINVLVSDSLCMPKYAHACMHGIQIQSAPEACLFLQAASYWASMMSSIQHTRQVCHTQTKKCEHRGIPENQQYQEVSVRTAALLHGGGMDQLLCSLIQHYLFGEPECEFCTKGRIKGPATKSVTEQFVRLPVMLLVAVQSQQVLPDNFVVSEVLS